ncbi:MAG: HlyD family efflux transporter periplasmic adaptor subunit [Anaerovoracaceae bacterium]
MPKIKRKTILILVMVACIIYVTTEMLPALLDRVTPTVTIEYGELITEDEVPVYILRDETVYSATTSGKIEYRVENGTQIKAGSKVIRFKKDKDEIKEGFDKTDTKGSLTSKYNDIIDKLGTDAKFYNGEKAKQKGVFSTFIDGNENYFTVENFDKITEEKAKDLSDKAEDVSRDKVSAKEPIYKITDNSKWYMMCFIDSEKTSRYEEGHRVKVRLPKGEVKCTVEKIVADKDKWKVLLSTNRYCKGFNEIRSADAMVTTLDIEGILVPNSCITTKNGVVGVYVVQKTGDNTFVPVRVLGNDGETSAVSEGYFYDKKGNFVSSVKIYDEIIKKPKKE